MMETDQPEMHFEDFVPEQGRHDIFHKVEQFDAYVLKTNPSYIDGLGLQLTGAADAQAGIREKDGQEHDVIMLGSNSYLGLTKHPAVIAASNAATDKFGYGMGAVSLYAGTSVLHRELEERIARFYRTEDAIVFPCGYSGNIGVISSLCGPGDVVINDSANHASIFDGCRLSGAIIKVYMHNNMKHLNKVLKALPAEQRGRLIITDGVFSMHGDLAPLDQIVALAEAYNCRLMVDDAHGLGVVGATGRGTIEHFHCEGKVDLTCGTLSKAPGAIGGYCAGSSAMVSYLRFFARTYFFSTSTPAPTIAGLIEVFKLLETDTAGRRQLWDNITYMQENLQKLGFKLGSTGSAILPVVVGNESILGALQRDLRHTGVFTNVVTYPAVRRKECRLRVSIMNSLSREQMDKALNIFAEIGRKHGLVP